MTSLRQISNRPCASCKCDRLHIGLTCQECKTNTYLPPILPALLDTTVKKTATRKARMAARNRMRAKRAAIAMQRGRGQ